MRYVLYALGALLLLAGGFILVFNRGMGSVRAQVISGVDLSQVADGTYTGRYSHARWGYTVAVTVKDHRIEKIDVTECTNPHIYVELNRKLVDRVLEEQGLDVDVVAGASISTRAFLKAVENALASPH